MNEHGTIKTGDLPALHWPEDPDAYVRCADTYIRNAIGLELPPRPAARRAWRWRLASWFAVGAVAGAVAATVGLSLGHAYEQHLDRQVVPTAVPAPVSGNVPVIYPTDLPGLLNAPTDQACAPGPQATLAPCDKP